MSERHTDNQQLEHGHRLTLPRVTQILVNGVLVGSCLAIALLATTMAAKVLVAMVGQTVFEDGVVLVTVIGLLVALTMRLVGDVGDGRLSRSICPQWQFDSTSHRAWELIRWLGVVLIVVGSLIVAPTVLSTGPWGAVDPRLAAPTPVVAQTRVVVAKRSLAPQTLLTADNVELRPVSVNAVQPNVETDINMVIGKALLVPVGNGQQILANIITGQSPALVVVAKRPLPASSRLTAESLGLGTRWRRRAH